MFQMLRLSVVTLLLVSLPLNAQDYVPDELQGWQQWVLKEKAYRNCPFFFDRTSAARSHFLCAWPDRLRPRVSIRRRKARSPAKRGWTNEQHISTTDGLVDCHVLHRYDRLPPEFVSSPGGQGGICVGA